MKTIRLKRRTLLAYVLSFSSCCLCLWIFLFLSSDHSLAPSGKIDRTALDSVADDRQSKRSVGEDKPENVVPVEVIIIPDNAALRNLSWASLADLYHRYLNQIQYVCKDIRRVGRVTDGGWDVCSDAPFAPKEPCNVYSFGVDNDFSFEDSIINNYGCHVYSFDPSMRMQNQQRSAKSYFFRQGVADSDRTLSNGWVMSKFETIMAGLKHTQKVIDIVKMDIEEWEWEVLPDLLASEHLKKVKQVLVELHQCPGCSKYDPKQEDKEPNRDHYIHMLELLSELKRQHFQIFHTHQNKACRYLSKFNLMERTACYEIGLLRVPPS